MGPVERARIVIQGAVQGVGFRPFVYRLATDLSLSGWVSNTAAGLFIEVEGASDAIDAFVRRVSDQRPPRSIIQSFEATRLDPVGFDGFAIRASVDGARTAVVLPDIATCPDCLGELFDPSDRRYRYPFTNCTNCGPRFSIILGLPYDRPLTTMARFEMCESCRAEYEDPRNRRFHAQPNACPACGPRLWLWDPAGTPLAEDDAALHACCDAIRRGLTVALKGLGGFHLIVDARDESAVRRLRASKRREEKPLALMYPDLAAIGRDCVVTAEERRLLDSPEAPIVLLDRRAPSGAGAGSIAPSVAPANPALGVMLPYTPLHHLIMRELGFPIVATSGNVSDEPICTDEREAIERLRGMADLFLVHDRPIARHVDDSVIRVMAGRELILRRARGYAPLPVFLRSAPAHVLAVGAHQKNTVAIGVGSNAVVSQHVGDLDTAEAFSAFERAIESLCRLYEFEPEAVACDAHPDYLSTRFAHRSGRPVVSVQHHHAHVAACMAENELDQPVLGVSWDGTGYGDDGTTWGGEFLLATIGGYRRVAHLRCFRLPGGDRAAREPRRAAIGVLAELFGPAALDRTDLGAVRSFEAGERAVLAGMLARGLLCPVTSSAGRLFDAVASLAGLRQRVRFEGQAAMELEFALHGTDTREAYPFTVATAGHLPDDPHPAVVDWEPCIRAIIEEAAAGEPVGRIAARFHNGLIEAIAAVAHLVGEPRVVLTGGCFQNRYLTEGVVRRLREDGFRPYWHQRVPPNDGGIALGQLVAAGRMLGAR